ncbi:MAG: RNA polymerase sigma factor [Bacteroidota bacterium]
MSATYQDTNPIELLKASVKGDRKSQEKLYRSHYSYAMAICMRYTKNKDEAMEICNDGFLKVFLKGEQFDNKYPFKAWLKRIMINTAIDFNRKNQKHRHHEDIENAYNVSSSYENAIDQLGYNQLLLLIQKLNPAYRDVFNLFVIDGYTHEEISVMLDIPVGTSKSKLSRAREGLRQMINELNNVFENREK